MEMLDLKQVVLTRKSTSPDPQYFLEITATDQVHGFPEVYAIRICTILTFPS